MGNTLPNTEWLIVDVSVTVQNQCSERYEVLIIVTFRLMNEILSLEYNIY